MKNLFMKGGFALFIVLMAAVFLWQPLTLPFSNAVVRNDFTLQSVAGPLNSTSLHGNVLAVSFAHADCPPACAERVSRLARAYEMLSARERGHVRMLLISADPERDTPARIQEYASRIHADIIGLSGKLEEVKLVADGFAALPQKSGTAAGSTIITSSAMIYIVDAEGKFASVLNENLPPEGIAQSLRSRVPPLLSPGPAGVPGR